MYDLSALTFDFHNDMVGHLLNDRIPKLQVDAPANSPTVVAYYPSVYVKEGKTIVKLNIKWLGVM